MENIDRRKHQQIWLLKLVGGGNFGKWPTNKIWLLKINLRDETLATGHQFAKFSIFSPANVFYYTINENTNFVSFILSLFPH